MKPFKCNEHDLNESMGVNLTMKASSLVGGNVEVGITVDGNRLNAYIGPNDAASMMEWIAGWAQASES